MASRGFSGDVVENTGTFRTELEFWTSRLMSASSLVLLCDRILYWSTFHFKPALVRS